MVTPDTQQAASEPISHLCRTAVYLTPTTIQPGSQCINPIVGQITVGCVHEHLDHGLTCQEHWDRWSVDALWCATCYDTDGHDCLMTVSLAPLDRQR